MIRKTYQTYNDIYVFGPERRTDSYVYARRDFTPTPEQIRALREWADPKKRAEMEKGGDRIMCKLRRLF